MVLLGAVHTIFPDAARHHGGSAFGGSDADAGGGGVRHDGWAVVLRLLASFLYLFTTSLALGILSGLTAASVLMKLSQSLQGPYQVCYMCVRFVWGMCGIYLCDVTRG